MASLLYHWKNYHWRTCEKCHGEELYGYYDDHSNKWLGCAHCYIDVNSEKLSDDEWRRLNYLLTLLGYIPNHVVRERLENKNYAWLNKELKNAKEIHALFDKLSMTEEFRFSYWHIIRWIRRIQHAEYKKKPVRVRKDNKNMINYALNGGDYHGNKIRYPRKKRKTAWKRFYKLFPSCDPKNKKS